VFQVYLRGREPEEKSSSRKELRRHA